MPGELTNVWAKSGAELPGPFTCESLLIPTVAAQQRLGSSSPAAASCSAKLVPQQQWDQGLPALPSLGVGSRAGRDESLPKGTCSLLETQGLDLSPPAGCLGFIPTLPFLLDA